MAGAGPISNRQDHSAVIDDLMNAECYGSLIGLAARQHTSGHRLSFVGPSLSGCSDGSLSPSSIDSNPCGICSTLCL